MSRSSLPTPNSLARSSPDSEDQSDAGSRYAAASLKGRVQFAGFWAAVGLPIAHVALLVHGLTSLDVVAAFVALLAVNVVALYVGHGYDA